MNSQSRRHLPQTQRRAMPRRAGGDDELPLDGVGMPAHRDIAWALHKELPVRETGDAFVNYASKTTIELGDVLGALGLRK